MKKIFKKSDIMRNRGCYERSEVEKLSFYKKETIHIVDIFNSEIMIGDAYWFLFRKCDLTLKEKSSHCLELAEIALPIYEARYPEDKRVSECIQGIKDFNKGKISRGKLLQLIKCANDAVAKAYTIADASSAVSAVSAVSAAHAAHAVAAAAYINAYIAADLAADAAAFDIAIAADLAADAAADAAYYAEDDNIKRELINCTIDFINSK